MSAFLIIGTSPFGLVGAWKLSLVTRPKGLIVRCEGVALIVRVHDGVQNVASNAMVGEEEGKKKPESRRFD